MANEKRLIDADALVEFIKRKMACTYPNLFPGMYKAVEYIKNFQTVDAAPVVRGWWKEYSHSALVSWKNGEPVWADRTVYRCSECDFGTIIKHNYCPRCGAKMD